MRFKDRIDNFLNEGTVSQKMIDEIAKLTDDNDHFKARIEIAGMMGNQELEMIYKSLELLHKKYKSNYAVQTRDGLEKQLYDAMKKKWSNWEELKGAL